MYNRTIKGFFRIQNRLMIVKEKFREIITIPTIDFNVFLWRGYKRTGRHNDISRNPNQNDDWQAVQIERF